MKWFIKNTQKVIKKFNKTLILVAYRNKHSGKDIKFNSHNDYCYLSRQCFQVTYLNPAESFLNNYTDALTRKYV